jgi:hypothetical protein
MPYNLLLLPLLGGFLFFHISHYFRFSAQRLDGYRLLFQTAIAGTGLAILARCINIVFEFFLGANIIDYAWAFFVPLHAPFSGTSALSLVLGPVTALIWNLFIGKKEAKEIEIRRHGNAFIQLLLRAQQRKQLVSITLDNRKWYVGWVTEAPNLDPQELYFRVLPYRSGYRDHDSLKTVYTTFYERALSDTTFDPEDLIITLPLKDVKTANLFDEDLYNDYFAASLEASPPQAPSTL